MDNGSIWGARSAIVQGALRSFTTTGGAPSVKRSAPSTARAFTGGAPNAPSTTGDAPAARNARGPLAGAPGAPIKAQRAFTARVLGAPIRALRRTLARTTTALAGGAARALRPLFAARASALGAATALAMLLGGAGAAQGQTTFTVTGPASITETDANQNLLFTVTRSGAELTAASTEVTWAITHDSMTGTDAADFAVTSGSVSFAAGDDEEQFILTVVGDNDAEEDEGFELQVSHATHMSGAAYDGTITGDDTHFTVAGPVSMLENDGMASPNFTFTRTGAELTEQYAITGVADNVPDGDPRQGDVDLATLPATGGFQEFMAGDDEKMGTPFRFQSAKTYAQSVSDGNDGDKDYIWRLSAVGRGDGTGGNPENHTFDPDGVRFTVLDNDIHLVVTAGPTSVTETDANAATGAYTITRLGGEFPSATTVTWTVNHGTAASATDSPTVAADFDAVTGTVDFMAGEDSKTFTVTIAGDTTAESLENFNLTASITTANTPAGYEVTSGAGYNVVLRDDEQTTVTVTAGTTALTETNADAATSTYTITRSGAEFSAETMVTWTVNHGTTVAGDFSAVTGMVTFAAGDDSGTFTLTVTGDTTAEVDKDFTLTASATGANSGPAYAVTLEDDDSATFTITGDSAITETDAGGDMIGSFTITRSGAALTASTTVFWDINHGTIADPTDSPTLSRDFSFLTGGSETFQAGEDTKTFSIEIIAGDELVEGPENFYLTARATGHNSGPGHQVVLNDDDTIYTITAGPRRLNETDADQNFTYTITREGVMAAEAVTWQVNHADMGGTADEDFSAASGTVNFGAGVASMDFTLTLSGDDVGEGTESFTLTAIVPGARSATLGTPYAVTVGDDDTSFTITAGPTSITETNTAAGADSDEFTITRSGPALPATITWTVMHGQSGDDMNNPTVAADFSAVTGDVTFAANEMTKTFMLSIVGDTAVEEDENFHIELSGPDLYSYGADYDSSILDNDSARFAVGGPMTGIAEDDSGATGTSTTFTINASGADLPMTTTTINWQIMHGTIADSSDNPTTDADFVTTTGTADFENGDNMHNIGIQVVGDNAVEMTENFHIVLTSTYANFRTNAGYDSFITDDDTAFAITGGPASLAETDAAAMSDAYTITRSGVELTAAATITWTIEHGTAMDAMDDPTVAADFSAVTGNVTFAAGDDTGTFTITVAGDNNVEMTENFHIVLSGPTAHAYGAAWDDSIADDDTSFSLSGPTTPTESDANQDLTYTITRNGQPLTAATTTVNWFLAVGTAADSTDSPVSNADFGPGFTTSGSVDFAPGENTKQFTVPIAGDNDPEDPENFSLSLSGPTDHSYGDALDVAITDDDANFEITVGPASIDETDGPAASMNYTITRTGAAVALQVTWTINPGTVANAMDNPTTAADFVDTTGTVDFTTGTGTRDFTITVAGENDLDGDKNFHLTLSAPGHSVGAGYDVALNDDEADFTLTVEAGLIDPDDPGGSAVFGVSEGAAENARQLRIAYTADDGSSALDAEATVTVTLADETPPGLNVATGGYPAGVTSERAATVASDFAASTLTCTIPANTAHNAVVPCTLPEIINDTLSERVEHFSVDLSGAPAGVTLGAKRYQFIRASDVIGMRITSENFYGTEGNTVDVTVEFSGDAATTLPAGLTEFRLLFSDGTDSNVRAESPGAGDTSLIAPTPIWARPADQRSYTFTVPANTPDSSSLTGESQTWQLRGTIAPVGWTITGGDSGDDGTFNVVWRDVDPTSWTVRSRGAGIQDEDVNESAAAIATPTTADTASDHADTMYFRFTNYEALNTRGETTVTYCIAGTATGGTATQVADSPNSYDYTWPGNYDPTSTSAAHSEYMGSCNTGRGSFTIAAGTSPHYRLGITLNDDNLNEGDETIIMDVVNVVEANHNTRLENPAAAFVATRTIKDNDAISISIANGGTDSDTTATGFQVQESQNAVWVVTLSKPSAAAASIAWTATGFEAADTSGTDPTSPLSIAAGMTTGTITFALAQDDDGMMDNMSEAVSVALDATGHSTGSGGGTIARSSTASEQSSTQNIIPRAIARDLTVSRYLTSAYTSAIDETVAANNVVGVEGNGGTGTPTNLYFAVGIGSSQTAFSSATQIYWRVNHAASTGTSDADFVEVSGSFMHPASATCTSACRFTVQIVGDNLNENNEIFTIDVSANAFPAGGLNPADGGTAPDSSAAITITDDDRIGLSARNLATAVTEGTSAALNLDLGAIPTTDVTVTYTIGSTSAMDDVDATEGAAADFRDPNSGSIVFTAAAGSRTQTLSFPINTDNLNEGPETFTVDFTFASLSGHIGTVGTVQTALNPVTFTIGASDPITVSIAADDATVQEGGSADFTVTLGGATAGSAAAITVPYTASGVSATSLAVDGTALPGSGSGSLTIAAGQTSGTLSIEIVPSTMATMDTADETLTVTLTAADAAATPPVVGPTAAAGGGGVSLSSTASEQSAQSTVEYLNNLHTITITTPSDPAAIAETDADANTTYTIAHSSGRAIEAMQNIVVTWAVTLGSASAADFSGGTAPAGGTLTFTSTDSADKTFDIGIAGDQLNEAGETFTLTLSIASANMEAANLNGGVDLPAAVTVTISDDDPVVVAVTRASGTGAVDEDSGTLDFTVTLTGGTRAAGVETIVPFAFSGLEDADFNITAPSGIAADALGGELSIAQGSSTGTITVTLVDNQVNEAQKTLALAATAAGDTGLRLSGTGAGAAQYSSGGDAVSVDVADDDAITVTLTRGGASTDPVREGSTVDIVATLTRTDGATTAVTSAADICVVLDTRVNNQQTPANDAGSGPDVGGLTDCAGDPVTLPLDGTLNSMGGINIPAGQSSAAQTFTMEFDAVPEGTTDNEELAVQISQSTGGSGAGTVADSSTVNSVTVEIRNVDAARSVSVSAGAATVQEGGEMVFSVTVTGRPVVTAFPLTWTITGVDESDISTGRTGMVSFTADADQSQMQSTQTQMVRITAVDDTDAEDDETLMFTLTDPCDSVTDDMCNTGGRPMNFSASAPAIQVSTSPTSVTIEQNDQPFTLSVAAPAALTEGTAANFTVNLAPPAGTSLVTSEAVTLDWAISFPDADTGATPPVIPAVAGDFMATSGSLEIPAGMSSADIAITAVDDDVNEAVESFTVTLSNPAGGGAIATPTLATTPSANGTVAANDPVTVQFSTRTLDPVVEGGNADFTIALVLSADGTTAATSGGAICVVFATSVGMQQMPANDADSGADIAVSDCDGMAVPVQPADGGGFQAGAATGGAVIPAGQSSATLRVTTRFDSIDEGTTNERLRVDLTSAAAATGATGAGAGMVSATSDPTGSTAVADIRNVNSLRTLSVSGPAVGTAGHPDSPANEDGVTGAGQTVPVEFGITMNGTVQPETPVVVRWQLNLESDGSISPPTSGLGRSVEVSDVSSAQSGTVSFGPGISFPTTQTVTVQLQQDALNEGAETLRLVLDPVAESAGGQPDMNVPGTRIIQDRAEATVAASDDITVFLTADAADTVTSGDDARYTMSFGTTTVNGQVVPIVPTTQITVPLSVMVGGQTVTVPDVVVQPGAQTQPVVITAAQIDAQTRGGGTAMIVVEAQAPTGAPTGAMARVAEMADLAGETQRRNSLSQAEREQLGLMGDAAVAPTQRQVAGWTVAVSQPNSDAPEGSDWQVVFALGGDLAALGGNTIEVPWSLSARSIGGGAEAAAPADFAASTATPPAYTCNANAEGVCGSFPSGRVTFRAASGTSITVAVRVLDDGVAEGDDAQGFSLTVGSLGGTAAAQTVTTGATTLQAQIPALRANLSVADATAAEGQSAEFVLRLSSFNGGTVTTQPITVAYMLTDGTATGSARSDVGDFMYPATPAGVTNCPAQRICTQIAAGAEQGSTHRIAVPLRLDGELEPRETFTLTITGALGGGGNIQLVADPSAASPTPVNEISATGTITDDADQAGRRHRRVSTLVTVLDRQTAGMATDAISARFLAARTNGAGANAQLSLANRNLLGAAAVPGEDAAGGVGLALYGAGGAGAAGYGATGAGLGGGAGGIGAGAGAAFGGLGAGLAGGANLGTRTALPTLAELLNGSSFSINAAQGLTGKLAEGAGVWGRAGYADLRGNPRDSGLSYNGDTVAAFVGADSLLGEKLLAGVALGYASGDLDFTDKVGAFEMKGKLSNETLSLHPYFGLQLSPGSSAWLVLGAGTGSLDVEENEGQGASAVSRKLNGGDTAMRMFAAGLSQQQQVGETGDVKVRVALTRVQSRVESGLFDDGALLPKTRGRSLRLGAEVEAGRSIALENGVSLRPFGTLRFRLDKSSLAFADEPKVMDQAIDWGAGLQASWAELGLGGRFAFSRQLNDTGHEEQLVSLDLNFAPGVGGQGIALSLQTSMEQRVGSGGGVGQLFGAGGALSALGGTGATGLGAEDSLLAGRQHSLSGEIAYGMALRYGGRGASRAALLTPYGRFDLGETERWATGLRFAETRSGLTMGLEAGLDLNTGRNAAPRSYDLLLTGSLPF